MEIKFCPVCGYGPFEEAYKSVEEIRSSYDICVCCGCEYGYDDNEAYYKEWVMEGCRWFNIKEKPKQWNLESQERNRTLPWPPNKMV